MRKGKMLASFLLAVLLGACLLPAGGVMAASSSSGVSLYTPYSNISVTPGQSVNYSIDVINNSGSIQNVNVGVDGLPSGWDAQLTAGGWTLHQISVKPNDSQSINLELNVPLKVDKGNYHFDITANGNKALPLTVNVSEQGTYATELTTDQPNMEGKASSSFTFNVNLKNKTADKQLYSLSTGAPQGWDVTFRANSNDVTSVNVAANASQSIYVDVKPPANVKAGKYEIPISASTSTTSAKLKLEAVITGTYKLNLTTPDGRLSANVTAGQNKTIELRVENQGSATLKNISMSGTVPPNWDVKFNPKTITSLAPGKKTTVEAYIKASNKAIAGDYMATLNANTPDTTSKADFRISVKTSMLWGWIGILVVLFVLAIVYYLFRAYGRR